MFKQPRVPEYRENEGAAKHLKALTLFLKDFCQDVWTATRLTDKGLAGIKYPVTSVNKKTGDVSLTASDVGAVNKSGDTMTGDLVFRSSDLTPTINFRHQQQAANQDACQIIANLNDDRRQLRFNQWHQDMDGAETRYKDCYSFPNATKGLTEHKYYDILTTKDMSKIYPVGSVYVSTESTSPASLFGGTWEQINGRFLFASNSNYAAGSTGGSTTVTLTVDQIPAHTHELRVVDPKGEDGSRSTSYIQYGYNGENTKYDNDNAMFSTGGGKSHSNMPPYLVVYMWKRVS